MNIVILLIIGLFLILSLIFFFAKSCVAWKCQELVEFIPSVFMIVGAIITSIKVFFL